MPPEHQEPPQYTRYRARRRLIPERDGRLGAFGGSGAPGAPRAPTRGRGTPLRERWRRWATVKRVLLVLGGAYSELQQGDRAAECVARAERLSQRWAA